MRAFLLTCGPSCLLAAGVNKQCACLDAAGLLAAGCTAVNTNHICRCCCRRSGGLTPGLRLPSLPDLQAFAATMGPLSVTYVCKNLCYILLQVRQQADSMRFDLLHVQLIPAGSRRVKFHCW